MIVVRNYTLPAFVNSHWFIIASSYSGDTEETLAAVMEASSRRCRRILALASGGRLAALARERAWSLIPLPAGYMPRATLGYSFAATMVALARWGIAGNNPGEMGGQVSKLVFAAADFLARCAAKFNSAAPAANNPAKAAAAALAKRNIVVLGAAGCTEAVALRFKSQLNENGKLFALASALPEANHSEIVGLDALNDAAARPVVVLPCTGDEGDGIIAQQRACMSRLCQQGTPVLQLNANGADRLQRLLYLVLLGDFISYHVAIIRGVDPTPIRALEEIKASLNKRS
jgi:glucose/mannose-6-phosphate isomerase